ncbi:hypothetical protein Cylst_0669 [Cylindrospermum stagnale PCC 7417]|uniref:Uncharacterized protein n=1 Tax=Cylindrospermum stagnale PCC 7417 TaxID=56107 RepID=K9WS06_9NOST|nr:hypothetical protein [Cylindrospermum stagnale]AFZ22998.1 hypothetical protein Cylst_0669 [Cylindrospermum stagnale PCC 7417]
MLSQMVDAYSGERDPDDNKKLEGIKQDNGGELPKEYVFEDEGGKVPREIDKKRILNDPPYTIDKVTRKGGFSAGDGATLNVDKVKALRG